MKLMHLSDLHIGKKVNEFSMLEDQKYILDQILDVIHAQEVEGVLISGDVYDSKVPSGEAVLLLDDFLTTLVERNLPIFLISGNHDSAERLEFGSHILGKNQLWCSGVFSGTPQPVVVQDEYGPIHIYLLPFIRPAQVRHVYEDADVHTVQEAVAYVLDQMTIDETVRNVLLAHQFVTGAQTSDSEEHFVGGEGNVDASLFDMFDYVALGHIHREQSIGRACVRYCGTPLKYSFSEAKHKKSVTIVELKERGEVQIESVVLSPLRDMHELRGSFQEVTTLKTNTGIKQNDYLRITLTDEEDIPNAMNRLRGIYPNLMKLTYDNVRTRQNQELAALSEVKKRSPLELVEELYQHQNNQPMSKVQQDYMKQLIECLWEGES